MLLLKNVDVYLLPMLCTLLVVGFHETAEIMTQGKLKSDLQQNIGEMVGQICRPDTECVPGSEYCDINLGPENRQTCDLGNELSMSFCCPVDKVIRSKRYRRMTNDDDDSELDKVLDRTALEPIQPLPEEPECGQNTKSKSKITKVQNAKANDWPWIAVLLDAQYSNFCGGVLLNRRFVLTAAHCFKIHKKQDIYVRLGEYDFNIKNETKFIDHRVTDIKLHPYYDVATHVNDIAIMKLKTPAEYSSIIRPICLPKKNMEVYNKMAVVAGWGQSVYDGQLGTVLHEVTIPIWEHEKCVSAFSQPFLKTNLCAASYEGGKDSCKGDSGGPLLVQREDGKWTNVGIVSWGIDCGVARFPGVYTKVTSYLKWIAKEAQSVI